MPEYVVQATNLDDLDAFTRGYLECAEWCDLDEELRDAFEGEDNPRWSQASLDRATAVCKDFQDAHGKDFEGKESQAGHDFWLTRNGHGAGFWDGDYPKDVGQRLTEASHAYGSCYIDFNEETGELEYQE